MRPLIIVILVSFISPGCSAEATITDGETLVLNGNSFRLDGIDAPKTDQVCLNENGTVWACGIEARDQLARCRQT
jgi:endonuclease YncB( thermonuclease family)